jgi:hypothetical protein
MSSFDTNITVSNGNYYGTQDLAKIFPTFEIKSEVIKGGDGGSKSEVYGSKTLSNNNTNTTEYHVFATYYYSQPNGDGGSTYNKFQASSAAYSIIIYDKKATSFSWAIRKEDGQIWDGGISFLVIYNKPNYKVT